MKRTFQLALIGATTLISATLLARCTHSVEDATASSAADLSIGTTANPLTGTISALTGSCPAVTFVIERKTVRVDAATTYGEAACSRLANGVRIEVVGASQSDGSINASSVRLLSTTTTTPPPTTPTTVTVSGTTRMVTGACPTKTFVVEAKTIRTSAETVFGPGTCVDLRDSIRAEVTGIAQSDGSVNATRVGIPVPTPPATTVTVSGVIASITGTCPAITLRLADRNATTSSSTFFDGRGCDGLAVGITATVTGVVSTTSTTILATKVASPR